MKLYAKYHAEEDIFFIEKILVSQTITILINIICVDKFYFAFKPVIYKLLTFIITVIAQSWTTFTGFRDFVDIDVME